MFPTAKRKRGPGKPPMPFKKRKLSMSKTYSEEKSRSRPSGKPSFGSKRFAGRKLDKNSTSKIASGSKGFRTGRTAGVSSRFGKSKEGKRFRGNKGERFGERKSGAQNSKAKGPRAKASSAFKAGQKGGHRKKDFKKKKEKR